MTTISVVVPVLNGMRTLPFCCEALSALNPAPREILFVDNGSTDGSLQYLETQAGDEIRLPIGVLREPRPGAAAARNAGIRAATGDIIAFTDADCTTDSDWLRSLIAPFDDPTIGAVAGRVLSAPPASTLELFSVLHTLNLPETAGRFSRWSPWDGGFPTANLAVRRSLLGTIHGFDELVRTYGEDYDLCARIYAQGLGIEYVPAARVAHHHRTTLRGIVRQAFGFGRAHPYLLRRHAQRGLWFELPMWSFAWERFPAPAWIDLRSADKKLLLILVLSCVLPMALWLLPPYAAWLVLSSVRRAASAGYSARFAGGATLAALLVLKSAAMTAGRWWGSIRYRALCF